MGLTPGWSLDMSSPDEEDKYWNMSNKEDQERAMKKLNDDKLTMLIASPPCGPFSKCMHVDYSKMSREEIWKKLKPAIEHLTFAVKMCRVQLEEGRLFMFEHPAGAMPWSNKVTTDLLGSKGVKRVEFDLCAQRMESKNSQGREGTERKRTAVLTNSKHVALILDRAKCTERYSSHSS